MIVLGADMHKRSHTIAAAAASTGEVLDARTVDVGARGFTSAVQWGRSLDAARVWALEDCRHVSGSFERFLLSRGERVVRVPTRLMAKQRRTGRDRGKSDRIDAIAVARAALAQGVEHLPTAELAGPELDIRLLVDHRERLVRTRTALYNDVLWHLHDLWPEQRFPGCALLSNKWGTRIARRLARADQSARVRIAHAELRQLRELTATINALEAEIGDLVASVAPQLLAEPGLEHSPRASSSARSPASTASPPTPASLAGAASHRSRSAQATPNATAWTAAATARSTPPSTASPSRACAATPKPAPTSPANASKARAPPKPSAAPNATSPAASGTCCSRPAPTPEKSSQHQLLDVGAAKAQRASHREIPSSLRTSGVLRFDHWHGANVHGCAGAMASRRRSPLHRLATVQLPPTAAPRRAARLRPCARGRVRRQRRRRARSPPPGFNLRKSARTSASR